MTLPALTTQEIEALNNSGIVRRSLKLGTRLATLETDLAVADDAPNLVNLAAGGVVAWNKISLATNVTANDTITIGTDTYQFKAAAGSLTDNAYIAVERGSDNDISGANLAAAINRTSVDANGLARNEHASIFNTDGVTKARAWGDENVTAVYVVGSNLLWIFAAAAPGGALVDGTAPDIACTDALTAVVAWSFANMNLSTSAGQKYTAVARIHVAVTTDLITATSVDFVLPFYHASAKAFVIGYTAANLLKEGIADYVTLAAGPLANTTIATLNFAAAGTDLLNGEFAFIEVWAKTTTAA